MKDNKDKERRNLQEIRWKPITVNNTYKEPIVE